MKKNLPIVKIVAGVIIAVAFVAGAVVLFNKSDDTTATEGSSDSSKRYGIPNACKLFTIEDAKKVLGASAQVSSTTPPSASNEDIEVTQCLYSQPSGDTMASIRAAKQASILVRGAKSDAGETSNRDVFYGAQKPSGVQDISGYGDAAYWNPEFGQLNVYKNGNWYILSVGGSMSVKDRKVDDAKKLADVLKDKL